MQLLYDLLSQIANFTGDFGPRLLILLFLILFIGEFHIAVPYLLETVWLLSGYNASVGIITPFQLVILWLVALAGRQAGATALFYLSLYGFSPVIKVYRRFFSDETGGKPTPLSWGRFKFMSKFNLFSPMSVATARLFWLRVPLTIALGVKRLYSPLFPAILISSIVWDGIYIVLGNVVGTHVVPSPFEMVLYSLLGMTAFYLAVIIVRFLLRLRRTKPMQN